MGRATRWLKNLFGIKNKDENERRHKKWSSIVNSGRENSATNATIGLCNNPETIPSNISDSEAAWLRSYCSETDKKRNKHAIAVAAAMAAAADAAVAAAQAAFAVVRLTSHGRGTMFGGGRQRWAATKIQTLFRGYLAKRALRALKGLVKLQAHVRGYLIRKQAKATLHSMQALIRAQATVRSQRSRNLIKDQNNGARKSLETCDETRSEQTVSFHSRRLSASIDTSVISAIDESPKIMEVDTGSRHKVRSGRFINNSISEFCDDPPFQASSSPLPAKVHHRLSMLDVQNDSDWGLTGDECRFSTAQSTPRFISSGGSNNLLATPTKSIGGDNFFCHHGNFPNYMANTQSYKAKSRSYSAPKQRPEPLPKKRLSLNELMDSRNSLSGVRMQRSCSQVQDATSFKNAVMGKLERSIDFSRDSAERNGFSRRW